MLAAIVAHVLYTVPLQPHEFLLPGEAAFGGALHDVHAVYVIVNLSKSGCKATVILCPRLYAVCRCPRWQLAQHFVIHMTLELIGHQGKKRLHTH